MTDLQERYPALFERADVSVHEGWMPIIEQMCANLVALDEPPVIVQIKEKFGDLRCYVGGDNSDEARSIIRNAEQQCAHTCDICGNEGSLRNIDFLMAVRCDKHAGRARYPWDEA